LISHKNSDFVKDKQTRGVEFTAVFLDSTEIASLPPHDLNLKNNTMIVLILKLDISEVCAMEHTWLLLSLGTN